MVDNFARRDCHVQSDINKLWANARKPNLVKISENQWKSVEIRDYRRGDADAITRLFYATVRNVNRRDYSEEQIIAWAKEVPDASLWHRRMAARCTLVADQDGVIIGFTELEHDGHLDMFYVQKDVIGRGVGRQLYAATEAKALELGLGVIFAEVSITARPFFEQRGFAMIAAQSVLRHGVAMTNFRMVKFLRHLSVI
jgi:putative acetyltransferase